MNLNLIKARLAAATPGPWGIQGAQSDYEIVGPGPSVEGWTQGPFVLEFSTWPSPRALKWKDAELIAHAPGDIAALVAEVERLRARAENAEDKATRFDLDAAGIEAREREAVELVDLRAENRKLRDVLEWVNNQCPGKCAGVCDSVLRDEANVANALHQELNDLFGWGDESMLHALLHVRNAVLNLRADLRTERFLRENADKLAASQVQEERAAVVAYLRDVARRDWSATTAYTMMRAIEAIEHGAHRDRRKE